MVTAAIWPTLDYSRVPYRLYHDPELYAREQERIFRGPGVELSRPRRRDPRTRAISVRPGSAIRRSSSTATRRRGQGLRQPLRPSRRAGAARDCRERRPSISASITNGATGSTARLTAIPFRRGVRGKGGLDPAFDMGRTGCGRCGSAASTARCSAPWPRTPSRSRTISARRSSASCSASCTSR